MSEVAPVKSTSGGGYLFEDLVGAFLAASMLARKSVIGDLGPPERISFQVKVDGWALDDMLVSFHSRSKGTRRWAVSIRSRPQIERVADRDFVANAWEELLGRTTSGFDPDRDYVGLVVSSLDKDTRKDLEELRNLAKEQEPEELEWSDRPRKVCQHQPTEVVEQFSKAGWARRVACFAWLSLAAVQISSS